jgi:2-polyprenyl-6-methoxyphenol hydroxylase-like FAD-dependent oxidoreductase
VPTPLKPALVAGGGPVGLAAALFLAGRGVPARVLERETEPPRHSRALGVNPRTLTLLESTGVTDRLLAQGRRLPAVRIWRRGRLVVRLDLSRIGGRYPFMLIHSQARTAALLEEALAERGVPVERGLEVDRVDRRAGEVVVHVRDRQGRTDEIPAAVLLGADGARSRVRETLGIRFRGRRRGADWRLYDVALETPLHPDEAHVFLLDGGSLVLIRLAGSVWRVVGNVADLLGRLPAGTRTGEVEWESEFGDGHRVAERFQDGNACLAGDAAHVHFPLGARGMNLGIEDAYVFALLAAEGRLADYDRLRRPVVRRVVERIHRVTGVVRGRSRPAHAVRAAAPALGAILALLGAPARRFILGLDHDVAVA